MHSADKSTRETGHRFTVDSNRGPLFLNEEKAIGVSGLAQTNGMSLAKVYRGIVSDLALNTQSGGIAACSCCSRVKRTEVMVKRIAVRTVSPILTFFLWGAGTGGCQ